MSKKTKEHSNWKHQLHEIIYEADTRAGKLFDIVLLITILVSILAVMLESVDEIDAEYHVLLNTIEWIITVFFTIEYIARVVSIKKPKEYIFSFYGVIDFLSTIPKYLSFFLIGSHALVALRALRLLRVFRILKLVQFLGASNNLLKALRASRNKITVFLFAVVVLCIILGTIMYLIEGSNDSGFTSIPRSVYWAIVTLTTVGYGDIAPVSGFGQFIASIVMILGYGIIAIPTGIISAEYVTLDRKKQIDTNTKSCTTCASENHQDTAEFCFNCGEKFND